MAILLTAEVLPIHSSNARLLLTISQDYRGIDGRSADAYALSAGL